MDRIYRAADAYLESRRAIRVAQRRGVFVFNRKCFQEMGEPTHVVLMYEPERNTIGLRPTGPDTKHAFKLNKKGNHDNWVINAKRFVRRHKLPIDCTVRFPTARLDHGVLLPELDFRVPVIYARTRRK